MPGLSQISSVVNGYLNRAGLNRRIKSQLVMDQWRLVVGKPFDARCEAVAVRNGLLFVCCDSPAIAHQMSFLKERYKAAIEQRIGKGVVTDIRFQSGTLTVSPLSNVVTGRSEGTRNLGKNDENVIQAEAACILDDQLRDAFFAARKAACLHTRENREKGLVNCPQCDSWHAGDSDCPFCREREFIKRSDMARLFLRHQPWRKYHDLKQEVEGLAEREFRLARRDLLRCWGREIDILVREAGKNPGDDSIRQKIKAAAMDYIVLHKNAIPQQLNQAETIGILGRKTAAFLFS